MVLASGSHAQSVDHSQMDHAAHMAEMARKAQRQAAVSERGQQVMPFSLAATTHVFTKTARGGLQQVLARKPDDGTQVALVRQHLRQIRTAFLQGDFSGPAHIHGQDMPGLAVLQAAQPGQLAIDYQNVVGGAQLTYTTQSASLAAALHQWFDAQLTDHGQDAMPGHTGHGAGTASQKP
jgi:hypothetical protein